MSFEFDPGKSEANLAKHGIDFEAAQALWLDERRTTLRSEYVGEERQLEVGRIDDRLWAAVITVRAKRSGSFQSVEREGRRKLCMERKTISAEEFDRLFDEGSDEIDQYIDWSSARRPGQEVERVSLDFPKSLVAKLDEEAKRRGVSREALIETWLSERPDRAA